MKDLVIYQGPRYLNVTATRKQYIIELGEIVWEYDVDGFENTFIYETSLNPYDFDEYDDKVYGVTMYGVSEEFYSELMETLATNICDFWNEPEIIDLKPNF
jgi:hypothetical protein